MGSDRPVELHFSECRSRGFHWRAGTVTEKLVLLSLSLFRARELIIVYRQTRTRNTKRSWWQQHTASPNGSAIFLFVKDDGTEVVGGKDKETCTTHIHALHLEISKQNYYIISLWVMIKTIFIHSHTHTCTHMHTHPSPPPIHTHTQTYTHTHMPTHTHTNTHTHTQTHKHTNTSTHSVAYTHTHVRTHSRTYTHRHLHAYKNTQTIFTFTGIFLVCKGNSLEVQCLQMIRFPSL